MLSSSSFVYKFASKSVVKVTTADFDANLQTKLEDNNYIASNPRKKEIAVRVKVAVRAYITSLHMHIQIIRACGVRWVMVVAN